LAALSEKENQMKQRVWQFPILVFMCFVCLACQPIQPQPSSTPPDASEIIITYSDDGIAAPSEVQGGLVTFNLQDHRSQPTPSEPQIVRLADGSTLDDYTQALGSGSTLANEMITQMGGAFGLNHFVLAEGNYFATLAGPPMGGPVPMAAFTVTAAGSIGELPTADVEVELLDFRFAMPDEIKAGPQLWHIANKGAQLHHLLIWQRNEGISHEELVGGFLDGPRSGPPPMQWVIGWAATSAGQEGWVELDLAVGEYAILSLLPDFSTTPWVSSQLEQGMHHLLKVTGK
jgi:hypothetical protein